MPPPPRYSRRYRCPECDLKGRVSLQQRARVIECVGCHAKIQARIIEPREVYVTLHAAKRMKQRIGIPRRAATKQAQTAFDLGTTHKSATGKLKRWLEKLFHEYGTANQLRVYGRHVYVFVDYTLVTVLYLPHEMEGGISKLK